MTAHFGRHQQTWGYAAKPVFESRVAGISAPWDVGYGIGQRLLVYISWLLAVRLTSFPKPKKRHKPNLEMGSSCL